MCYYHGESLSGSGSTYSACWDSCWPRWYSYELDIDLVCSSKKCVQYYRSYDKCGCEVWNSWGPWGNVDSCTSSDTIDCRTLYY